MSDLSPPPPPPPPPPPLTPPPPGVPQYRGGTGFGGEKLGKATAAMVCGIVGVVLCALLAPVALVLGHQARGEIDRSGGRYTNRGQATAGFVLGIIGLCLIPVNVLLFLSVN